ncbi:MAG: ORC1-type DNA replication protein [Candidatus Altiarchaeota archaeon]|nr:ORC1-type DNA replication protein [Candidatus Altiarchaeota archaeon]
MKPKDILLDDETLFRSEEVFTPSYVPEDFIHRDDQLKELSLSMKPGLRGVNPVNTLVYGPPGTGKTTAVKYLFNEIKEVSGKLVTVYVNCEDNNTRFNIFAKIHEVVLGHSPPDTGKPLNSIKEKVFKKLQKEGKSLVVALDEMDELFLNNTIDQLAMDLLKSHTTYGYDKVGIIGIMIDDRYMADLDAKTKSIFNPTRVFFPPYARKEAYEILSNRVKYGLYDGVLPKELLDDIVEKTVAHGDLRVGIDLIRKSALLAERDAMRKVEKKHVEAAYAKESSKLNLENTLKSLNADERKLLSVIVELNEQNSGKVYEKFREVTGAGVKRYNEMIGKMEHCRLIDTVAVKGSRGQTRDIILRYNTEDVVGLLK